MEKAINHEITAIIIAPPMHETSDDVINAIKRQCREIIVIRGRQRALQRNIGLRIARTKYVLMVDTDEIISRNFVKALFLHMRDNVAVCCGINVPHPNLSIIAKLEEYFKCIATFQTRISTGRLYDREKALEVGGFKVVPGELSDFAWELLDSIQKRGYGVVFEPKAIVIHLKNYSIRKVIRAGLTAPITKYNPLLRLFARIFSAPVRVAQHFKKVYNICPDALISLLFIYAPIRQLTFFLCGLVRRIVR